MTTIARRESSPAGMRASLATIAATRALLPLALLATLLVQLPIIRDFWLQDDYVAFGEIARNGSLTYLRELLLAQDIVPNWRVVSGVMFLVSYNAFGMTPVPLHIAALAVHAGTAALLYRLVVRATRQPAAAFTGALAFGISPAYAGIFPLVGAVNHVLAALFLLATLNAVLEAATARDAKSANLWFAATIPLYALVIASNEAMATMFPVFAVAYVSFDARRDGRIMRAVVRSAPLAAIALATAIAFTTCGCNEASTPAYGWRFAHREFVIYLGRLLYPVGLEPPDYIDPPHLVAAIVLLALMAYASIVSPLGRAGSLWMALAIFPHILIKTHTAARFTYLATPGFAMLVAAYAALLLPRFRDARPWLPAAAGVPLLAVAAGWYAYQTIEQNWPYRDTTEQWRTLHDELTRVYPQLPPHVKVHVIGGPLTHPLDEFVVMPSLARTIWGPTNSLETHRPDGPEVPALRAAANPYIAEFQEGRLVPLARPPNDNAR